MKKKTVFGLGASVLAAAALAVGFSAAEDTHAQVNPASLGKSVQHVKLNLNGVDVQDPLAHLQGKVVYGSVETFAQHYNVKWSLNKKTNQLTLDGKKVTKEYGAPKLVGSFVVAPIQALAETLGDADKNKAGHFETGWDAATKTENVAILPKGVAAIEGHFVVPNMGSHWIDPKSPMTGPIWGTYKGKLVFLEYMPDNDLDHDVTLEGTKEVPIPTRVDHTDVNWNPHGHPGDENPHHDVHLYFISKEEQAKIK